MLGRKLLLKSQALLLYKTLSRHRALRDHDLIVSVFRALLDVGEVDYRILSGIRQERVRDGESRI
jgi:hypothetical protein